MTSVRALASTSEGVHTESVDEDIEVWVRRSRDAQGLPAKITDPETMRRLRALFSGPFSEVRLHVDLDPEAI